MNRSLILVTLICISSASYAQSLEVTTEVVSVHKLKGVVNAEGIHLTDSGDEILTASYTLPSQTDPSLEVYPMTNGDFVVRENIANFLVYDSFGIAKQSISNSSQSEGGEAISQLAMDSFGKTIVLYNPQVVSGGNTGSRAQRIDRQGNRLNLFFSSDRALRFVKVSGNGEFIAFTSEKPGTDNQVQLMDRFGNILNTISFDQEVAGVSFSENGLYATVYSVGRAAVFRVRDGERVGSTSFRNTSLKFAGYDPVDKTILAVTGSGETSISNVELHAVNVEARKIARQEISATLTAVEEPILTRSSSGRYIISGYDNNLTLRASF
ncbi:MAG: hypothetical protein MI700_04325 [Balneolales bacterium]|nr:hypothetical protein [Balneolales bacterium]